MPIFVTKWFLRWNPPSGSSTSAHTSGIATRLLPEYASSGDVLGNRFVIERFARTPADDGLPSLRRPKLDSASVSILKDDVRKVEFVDCPVRGLRIRDGTLSLRLKLMGLSELLEARVRPSEDLDERSGMYSARVLRLFCEDPSPGGNREIKYAAAMTAMV